MDFTTFDLQANNSIFTSFKVTKFEYENATWYDPPYIIIYKCFTRSCVHLS